MMKAAGATAALVLSIAFAGCADPPSSTCYDAGVGMMIGVEVNDSTTPAGEQAPTGADAFLLVFLLDDERERVGVGETDVRGCAAFDQPGGADLPPGRYEIEASIDRGSCDWWDSADIHYDGQMIEVPLELDCHQIN